MPKTITQTIDIICKSPNKLLRKHPLPLSVINHCLPIRETGSPLTPTGTLKMSFCRKHFSVRRLCSLLRVRGSSKWSRIVCSCSPSCHLTYRSVCLSKRQSILLVFLPNFCRSCMEEIVYGVMTTIYLTGTFSILPVSFPYYYKH